MIIRTKEVSNAKIYAVQTLAFSSSSYAETILAVDEAMMVQYPYSVYITVVSDFTDNPASFTISYWFDDRDPDTLTDEEKAASRIGPVTNKDAEVEEKALYENPKFWILVAVLIAAVVITIAFCICLIVLKRKNERISSKIQMLQKGQKGDFDLQHGPQSRPVIDDAILASMNRNGLSEK